MSDPSDVCEIEIIEHGERVIHVAMERVVALGAIECEVGIRSAHVVEPYKAILWSECLHHMSPGVLISAKSVAEDESFRTGTGDRGLEGGGAHTCSYKES